MTSYFERLRTAASRHETLLCVGLDPEPDRIPGGASGAVRHCVKVIRQTSDVACCYKPNSAFWEQYGPDGWKALMEVRAQVPDDIPVILDAKRADIGNTNAAYARAIFWTLGMDAVTIHAYHGLDSIEEFTRNHEHGVYIVCRTSNPGAADLQHLEVGDGRLLYDAVADLAQAANAHGNVGIVVGATAPAEMAALRNRSSLPFLIPGVGAQGGDLEGSVRAAFNGDPASALVNVSRAIMYADEPGSVAAALQARMRTAVREFSA